MVFKKDYEFDNVFYVFDEIYNNHHELHKYNPRTCNMIIEKMKC